MDIISGNTHLAVMPDQLLSDTQAVSQGMFAKLRHSGPDCLVLLRANNDIVVYDVYAPEPNEGV